MHKFKLIILMFIILLFSDNIAFSEDFEILYSVNKAKAANVKSIADFYSRQSNMFSVDAQDNYTYVVASSVNSDYYIMIFEQKGEDTLFYLYSNEDKKDIVKDILKRLKHNYYSCSKNRDENFLKQKHEEALKIYSLKNNKYNTYNNDVTEIKEIYDFSDEAQKKYNKTQNINVIANSTSSNQQYQIEKQKQKQKNKYTTQENEIIELSQPVIQEQQKPTNYNPPQRVNITVPIILQSSINSESLDATDKIAALLKDDLYVNNRIIAKQGSIIYGTATEAKKASGAYRNGSITLLFDKILTTDGEEISFSSEPIVFTNEDSNRGAKIAGAMTGGILLGMAGAALTSLFSSEPNWGMRLTAGALTGALGSGFVVMSATGEQVELKEGQILQIKISNINN